MAKENRGGNSVWSSSYSGCGAVSCDETRSIMVLDRGTSAEMVTTWMKLKMGLAERKVGVIL